jgi:hypothetical protein
MGEAHAQGDRNGPPEGWQTRDAGPSVSEHGGHRPRAAVCECMAGGEWVAPK